jgi:hypothetical protein
LKKYLSFINEEVGIRNLKNVVRGYKNCEIWLHKDLDGICSAIALKSFFKTYYDLDTIDCHIIQYGGQEFAVKTGQENTLKILCDFAHGKPMFHIQSDHHDKQIGADSTKSKYFKPARSNVETISGEISYSDVFTPQDIELVKTVDSANFLAHDIKPEDVQNSIFKFERTLSGEKNRFMMGFIVNRLLLAYKNKRISCKSIDGKTNHINRNFLECLVLDSNPSLYSIFNNIRHYVNSAKTKDKLGRLAKPEDLMKNLSDYIERMKNYKFVELDGEEEAQEYDPANWKHRSAIQSGSKISKGVHFDKESKIISQYGGGNMFKPGSYDRYVPFKNFPEANFICIVWPMGLIQVSCNPFKEKKLKNINLGEIAKEIISTQFDNFSKMFIPLEGIKRELEYSQDWKKMAKEEGPNYVGVGFRSSDLEAFYADCIYENKNGEMVKVQINDEIRKNMDLTYEKMNGENRSVLSKYKIPLIDLITKNSGGHPSITNIQGFNFMKYDKKYLKEVYKTEKYTDVMKKIARDFINNLKEKVQKFESGEDIKYAETNIELKGQDTNENYEYYLSDKDGQNTKVNKDEFVNAGSRKGMRPTKRSGITIDTNNKRIIAKFERFKNIYNS